MCTTSTTIIGDGCNRPYLSAFDVSCWKVSLYKGQDMNQIAAKFLDATTDICPNWKLATPDPMVTVGVMCQGFPVEMIVRAYSAEVHGVLIRAACVCVKSAV